MTMQNAMLFIGMGCTKPTCGALGFCDDYCGMCGHGTEVSKKSSKSVASTPKYKKDRDAAYKKWMATPKIAALDKAHQSFNLFLAAVPAWDKKVLSSTSVTLGSLQDHWDYLADNQHLVKVRIVDDGL